MVINIKNNDYEVRFGIAFVRALDEKYYYEQSGLGTKFGTGMETLIPRLLLYDPVALSEFLYFGTCTEKKRPSQMDVDAYVDQVEDIDALFDEVIQELKKQNATKKKMEALAADIAGESKSLTAGK